MSHPTSDELLDLALGTLPEERAGAVSSHLRECGECAGAAARLRDEQETLREHFRRPVPAPGLEAAVIGATGRGRRPPARSSEPVFLAVGAAAVVLALLLVALLLYPGGDDEPLIRNQVEIYTLQADRALEAGEFGRARDFLSEALALLQGDVRFSSWSEELRYRLRDVEETMARLDEADRRFGDLRSRIESARDADYAALWKEGKILQADVSDLDVQWREELALTLEKVRKTLDTNAAIAARSMFQVRRNEIVRDFRLAGVTDPDWSGAVRAWRTYLGDSKLSDAERNKATAEIQRLNTQAREEVVRLRRRAERIAEEGRKAGALELLRKARPRFEHTFAYAELAAAIRELER